MLNEINLERYLRMEKVFATLDMTLIRSEVDYVVSRGPDIFPIEVKAGRTGSLRSLHQFVAQKNTRIAFRFDMNPPTRQHVEHLISPANGHTHVLFDLISLPLYAVGELRRLLDALRNEGPREPAQVGARPKMT